MAGAVVRTTCKPILLAGWAPAGNTFAAAKHRRMTSTKSHRLFLLLLLPWLSLAGAWAQSDTATVYDAIHEYSKKHKFMRWIYSGIFVEPRDAPEAPVSAPKSERVDAFKRFEGKMVRRIEVRTFDPFGYSVDDTTKNPVAFIQRAGNAMHRQTRPVVVRNLLLVKPGRPLDPLEVSESERVLRTQPFVNDARIVAQPVAAAPDSLDLLVLVHDKWSIGASGSADLSSADGKLSERNFLGLGQSLEQGVGYTLGEKQPRLNGSHEVYNIGRTHISSLLAYHTGPDANGLSASLQRPFYSPLATWAAGASWSQGWSRHVVEGAGGEVLDDRILSPASLDLWAGRAFRLGDGTEPGSRNSNFVLAGRYAQTRYATRPPVWLDTLGYYRSSSLFLASTGLSIRQYYKERYLFRFGSSEDVPEGLLLSITTGVRKIELMPNMPYIGAQASRGRHYEGFGYLNAGLGYGTFVHRRDLSDATLNLHLLYFSDLRNLGRWHFRQFVRFNSVYGYNKLPGRTIELGGSQMYGLPNGPLAGTHKEILRSETVLYAPYNLLGFKIAPVLLVGAGTIGMEGDPIFSGRIHTAFTLGLLVRNENLLVQTFEVSLGFYPSLPGNGAAGFDLNSFTSFSPGAPGFDFGVPAMVAYE